LGKAAGSKKGGIFFQRAWAKIGGKKKGKKLGQKGKTTFLVLFWAAAKKTKKLGKKKLPCPNTNC
jgi:hypothetical protein